MATKKKYVVTGEQYRTVDRRMREIKRQLDLEGGSPLHPEQIAKGLQLLIEGENVQVIDFDTKLQILIADWENFYKEVFCLEVDFSNLQIPKQQKGFDRLIIVAKGMTAQRLFDKCKELFPSSKWTDDSLDEIITSERSAKDCSYAVWFRDRVEADKENRNLSANWHKKHVPTSSEITLEERLLYELKYFDETSKHLDVQYVTLCSGSRNVDGSVPRVYFHDYKVHVDYYHPDLAYDRLRARAAVF